MPQFILPPTDLDLPRGAAVLRGAEARHCAAVLRLRPGDALWLSDGAGRRWRGVCAAVGAERVDVEDLHPVDGNEPSLHLELLQGLPKGERWEELLEKGTELGVVAFRPLITARSIPQWEPSRLEKRLQRWRDKVQAAVKQCERGRLPVVHAPEPLEACLQRLGPPGAGELRLVLAERSAGVPWPAGEGVGCVRLAAGPEGGWTEGERARLDQAGFQPLSLGPRILRTDTAALAGSALVMQRWGDLVSGATRW